MIKKLHLAPKWFTIENGTLTPTLKIKRHEAKKMYIEAINKMYAEPLIEEKSNTQSKDGATSPATKKA